MKQLPEKLHALAATARIANVPSVAGNIFLGIAVAKVAGHLEFDETLLLPAALLIGAGICLYLAGNFLNDWADRDWDAIHRPERGLPRGLFPPLFYLAAATGLGLLGLCCAAAVSLQSLIIAIIIALFVLLYTWVHKRAALSVIPMGLCRALLPLLGFSGFAAPLGFSPSLSACMFGLFCHIAGLSLSARCESMESAPVSLLRLSRLLFLCSAFSMFFAAWLGLACPLSTAVFGLLPYALWIALCLTVFRKPVPVHVSGLLAGIPLVDWVVLLPLALAPTAAGPFATACMIVSPLAFLSGRALQRLAPAT